MYRPFFPYTALMLVLFLIYSCAPVEIRDEAGDRDNDLPPKISGYTVSESRTIEFHFTKELRADKNDFEILPSLGAIAVEEKGKSIAVVFSEDQSPGERYFIKGRVTDNSGNTLSFSADFYGFNPFVPEILVNEFTTNGSSDHPDMVELYIREDGNMAGVLFCAGCGCYNDMELLFPPFDVSSGEYIVIHTKPEGIPEEINETGAADLSGGKDASGTARDFWVSGGSGLSGNNGALTIFSSPGGRLIDAVIYSNRTSLSDEKYRGFGSSSMLHKADCISGKGSWTFSGELIAPEDCINPGLSTATRSLCRPSSSSDTDSAPDWHTVPTGGYTFGSTNSDEIYVPE